MKMCEALHRWANSVDAVHFEFPYDTTKIPLNGVYILFEKGEVGHGGRRISRVGTHRRPGQLRSRLRQHFLAENKDRSIFRKNIGRALLNRDCDPFLSTWELDLISRAMRTLHSSVDLTRQAAIERQVSAYIRERFSFVVVPVEDMEERMRLESRMISTVSLCQSCGPSDQWLGRCSPKAKIRESGLWLVNELYKEPLSDRDLGLLETLTRRRTLLA